MFNISTFISYVFVVTFTPGPNNIMSMINSVKFGYKKTLSLITGISTGFFIIMLLCSYFNLLIFNLIPTIKIYMGILGAIYMIFLALQILKKNKDKSNIYTNISTIQHKNTWNYFFTGIILQFINPKVIIYGITVISNFIIPYYNSNTSLILFSLLLAFMCFIATSCWALFGSIFNKFLTKYEKQFNMVMALLLIYCAFSISGITH